MAEEQNGIFSVCSSSKKKRLPSIDQLIWEGDDLLREGKKKRKPLHYVFSNDPTTGQRNCKNTSKPQDDRDRNVGNRKMNALVI